MLPHHWTRLPLPHLFLTVSVGALALMALAAGGPEGSSRTLVALLAFLALLVATIRVARGRAPGQGRPVLGLLLGLLTGVAGAASLLSIGVITPSSPLWVYLPLVVATLATLVGGSASARVVEDSAVVPLPATIYGRRYVAPSDATAGSRYTPQLASQAPTGS